MTDGDIGLFEAIYTQRAIRSFKPDQVSDEQVIKLIEAATKAPSAGNTQPWAFVVVRDRQKLNKFAEYARAGFAPLYEGALKRMQPGDPEPMPRLKRMIENFERIPCLIIVCLVNPEGVTGLAGAASVYPAVQNLLLAARGLGLGAAITQGWAGRNLAEIREMLALPANVEPAAYIPVGYPDQERYGKTTRRPWAEVTHWDGWEGEKANTAAVAHR